MVGPEDESALRPTSAAAAETDPSETDTSEIDHDQLDPSEIDDEPLLPLSDDTASRPAPGRYGRRTPGCLWQLVFFVIMVVLGIVAAATLRGRGGTSATTLTTGSVPAEKGDVTWKVKASVDDQRARCINLYVGDAQDALTGGCLSSGVQATGADVHEAPLPGSKVWVIFGLAPKRTRRVRLSLTSGASKVVTAETRGGVADGYYVWAAPAGVHTAGDAVLEGS